MTDLTKQPTTIPRGCCRGGARREEARGDTRTDGWKASGDPSHAQTLGTHTHGQTRPRRRRRLPLLTLIRWRRREMTMRKRRKMQQRDSPRTRSLAGCARPRCWRRGRSARSRLGSHATWRRAADLRRRRECPCLLAWWGCLVLLLLEVVAAAARAARRGRECGLCLGKHKGERSERIRLL